MPSRGDCQFQPYPYGFTQAIVTGNTEANVPPSSLHTFKLLVRSTKSNILSNLLVYRLGLLLPALLPIIPAGASGAWSTLYSVLFSLPHFAGSSTVSTVYTGSFISYCGFPTNLQERSANQVKCQNLPTDLSIGISVSSGRKSYNIRKPHNDFNSSRVQG